MQNILKQVQWDKFKIEDLFSVTIGQNIDGNKVDKSTGKTPYITRKESNNGLDGFINASQSMLNISFPVITIGNETAEPFVQTYNFFTGTKVNILIPKVALSKYVLLFICNAIKMHKSKYSYSYSINSTRLKKQTILLPINKDSVPDYEFMEQYMVKLESKKISSYKMYISERKTELFANEKIASLNEKVWNEFKIGALFNIKAGKSKGLNHLKRNENGISYLGATNNNNGVLALVEQVENMVQKGNCIAFIRNGEGSMGYSIYKKEDFIATSDITVGYNENLNPYVGMFITTVADKVRGKYNFGYKRSDGRLKKETLQLPVNEKGEPDYKYMEQYIKQIEIDLLTKYLTFINNRK